MRKLSVFLLFVLFAALTSSCIKKWAIPIQERLYEDFDAKHKGFAYIINDTDAAITITRSLNDSTWTRFLFDTLYRKKTINISPGDTVLFCSSAWDSYEYYPSKPDCKGGLMVVLRTFYYEPTPRELGIRVLPSDVEMFINVYSDNGTPIKSCSSFDTDDDSSIFLEGNWDPEDITYRDRCDGGYCHFKSQHDNADHAFHRWYYHFTGIQ